MDGEGQEHGPGARTGLAELATLGWGWLERHARTVLAVYWPALVLGTHWPRIEVLEPPVLGPGHDPLYDVLRLDKVLHLTGFGGLMALLILSRLGGRRRPWQSNCRLALAVGVGFAVLDETTQGFLPHRTVGLSDLIANLLAVFGVYLIAVLPARRLPQHNPRRLRRGLLLSLPVLAFLVLSPWVMSQLLALKAAWLGKAAPSTSLYRYDHIGHAVMSFVLSVVVFIVWPMAARRPRVAAVGALLVMGLSAPGLEVAQRFTGRSVEWQDELAHAIGLLLAMMVWAARLTWSPRLREPSAGLSASTAA